MKWKSDLLGHHTNPSAIVEATSLITLLSEAGMLHSYTGGGRSTDYCTHSIIIKEMFNKLHGVSLYNYYIL